MEFWKGMEDGNMFKQIQKILEIADRFGILN